MLKIKKNNIGLHISAFILFYLNFPFYFNILSVAQKILINILFLCFMFVSLRRYYSIVAQNKNAAYYLVFLLFIYFILIFLSMILPFVYDTYDFSYGFYLVNTIIRIIRYQALFVLLYKYSNGRDVFLLFMRIFVSGVVFYVFSTVILILFPVVKEFWYSVIDVRVNETILAEYNIITRYGFSGFSGFVHTYLCSLGVLFSIFLLFNDAKVKKLVKKYYFSMFVCVIGNFFYGRIGVLCSTVFVFIFIFYKILIKHDIKLFVLIAILVTSIISVFIYLVSTNELFKVWFNWAFEPFINFFVTGEISSGSSDWLLNEMYFFPSPSTILFGDGRYAGDGGGFYMKTDSGILRPVLFYGLLPFFSQFFIIFTVLFLIKKLGMYRKYNYWNIFIYSLLFILIFFTIKGEIYQSVIDIYLLLMFLLMTRNKQRLLSSKINTVHII